MAFSVSAPTKVIISGEHSVVYGGEAVAAPLGNRRRALVNVSEGAEVIVDDVIGSGRVDSALKTEDSDGRFRAKAALITHVLGNYGRLDKRVEVKFEKKRFPKGTGASASTGAVLAVALYEALGIKPKKDDLFNAVQAMEEVAHGGKPSGIDATAVLADKPVKFTKKFVDGKAMYDFLEMDLRLPAGSVLLVADTLAENEAPETTSELITRFAIANNISKTPAELTADERHALIGPYNEVVEAMEHELHDYGNAKRLGELMTKNHELLRRGNVSTPRIEEGIAACLESGAFGAKITGAGGRGGAFIALAEVEKAEAIKASLKVKGFDATSAEFSTKGATVE